MVPIVIAGVDIGQNYYEASASIAQTLTILASIVVFIRFVWKYLRLGQPAAQAGQIAGHALNKNDYLSLAVVLLLFTVAQTIPLMSGQAAMSSAKQTYVSNDQSGVKFKSQKDESGIDKLDLGSMSKDENGSLNSLLGATLNSIANFEVRPEGTLSLSPPSWASTKDEVASLAGLLSRLDKSATGLLSNIRITQSHNKQYYDIFSYIYDDISPLKNYEQSLSGCYYYLSNINQNYDELFRTGQITPISAMYQQIDRLQLEPAADALSQWLSEVRKRIEAVRSKIN